MRFGLCFAAAVVALLTLILGDSSDARMATRAASTNDRATPKRAAADLDAKPPALMAEHKPASSVAEPHWVVRVVGRDGGPASPSLIFYQPEGCEKRRISPRSTGVFVIPNCVGTLILRCHRWKVERDQTVIRIDTMWPLEVVWRDAETHARLARRSTRHADADASRIHPPKLGSLNGRVTWPWPKTDTISRYATSVRADAVAFRHANIRVRVSGASKDIRVSQASFREPSRDFCEENQRIVWINDESWLLRLDTKLLIEADGWIRVRGVPAIHGEIAHMVFHDGDRTAEVQLPIRRGDVVRREFKLERKNLEFSLGVLNGSSSGFRRLGRMPPLPPGALLIQVVRRDGRPAAHAKVRVGYSRSRRAKSARTDVHGVARFDSLPGGRYDVELVEPGILYVASLVDVAPGRLNEMRIREPDSWSTRLRVRDDEGQPLSGAYVVVKPAGGLGYAVLQDGVQQLTHVTDRDGELRITPLPPGPVSYTVCYGSREVRGKIADGAVVSEVTIPFSKSRHSK